MDYSSDLHEPRTNAEQSETGGDLRGSFVSRTDRKPFPYKQDSEEEFARMCRADWRSVDAKYTYFMRDRRTGLIKIGMSRDPYDRKARLSASGARDMEILLLLRSGNLEGCYHQHFADLRVEGEWFEPHPDIFAEIERLKPEGTVW